MELDERCFINSDGRLRTPIKLYSNLSGKSKSLLRDKNTVNTPCMPVVPPKRVMMGSSHLKRPRGDSD